jgi:hypothetical protein
MARKTAFDNQMPSMLPVHLEIRSTPAELPNTAANVIVSVVSETTRRRAMRAVVRE